MKFGAGSEQRESHQYHNVFERQRFSDGQERLRIGPSRGHVDLMIELIECIPEPLRLLYVLVLSRGREQSGRYEAPLDKFVEVLQANGLKEGTLELPAPHWHGYHPEFDEAQSRVLSRFQWIHSRLHAGDDA